MLYTPEEILSKVIPQSRIDTLIQTQTSPIEEKRLAKAQEVAASISQQSQIDQNIQEVKAQQTAAALTPQAIIDQKVRALQEERAKELKARETASTLAHQASVDALVEKAKASPTPSRSSIYAEYEKRVKQQRLSQLLAPQEEEVLKE